MNYKDNSQKHLLNTVMLASKINLSLLILILFIKILMAKVLTVLLTCT